MHHLEECSKAAICPKLTFALPLLVLSRRLNGYVQGGLFLPRPLPGAVAPPPSRGEPGTVQQEQQQGE